jgi:xylulokinase
MVADVFELPVDVPAQAEGAAFGAALQALWALDHAGGGQAGIAALAAEHVRLAPELSALPDANAAAVYRSHYDRFRQYLEAAVASHAHRSAADGD